MKKVLILIIMVMLIGTGALCANPTTIEAKEYYSYSCGDQFELSYITDDGQFQKDSCYVSFDDALKAMNKKGSEYVVRHNKSLSPTKIIAMVSGNAYSYPARSGHITMNVFDSDKYNHNTITYLTNHYEMRYEGTTVYLTSDNNYGGIAGGGMIKVSFDGFEGYADLEYTDLVPDKFIDNGLPIYLGGNDKTNENEQPFLVKVLRSYYTVEQNGNYKDLVFYNMRAYPTQNGQDGNPSFQERYIIGPAPSEMKTGTKYYSYDGHNYYSDYKCQNHVVDYYNYYQYLPLRSKTEISASDLNAFLIDIKGSSTSSVIKNKGQAFIDAQNEYGVNALLLYAMACHESNYGTSPIALNYNNLFGWNAVDSDPGNASYYSSVEACIDQHAGRNLKGYLDLTDYRFFGSHLGNKGSGFNVKYASDPYWGMGIASLAYQIDKFANDYDGTLSDYGSYDLAIVDKGTAFLDSPSSSGKTYDTALFGVSSYFTTLTVIPLEVSGNYVKVQFTSPIINSKVDTSSTMNSYDFSASVAYVDSSKLHMINGADMSDNNQDDSTDSRQVMSISDMTLDADGKLKVAGTAFMSHYNYSDSSKISHELMIYSLEDNQVVESYSLNTLDSNGISLNDGFEYDYVNFEGTIDLADLPYGNYIMKVKVSNGDNVHEIQVATTSLKYHGQYQVSGNDSYLLHINQQYRSRIEISKTAPLFDYDSVNKPSKLNSLLSINTLGIENNTMVLEGIGYMLFTDFGKENNVSFSFYLVSNDGQKYEFTNQEVTNYLDYTDILKTGYDLSDVCYNTSIDLSNIEDGTYYIAAEIRTNQYYDVVYLVDRQQRDYDAVNIAGKTMQLDTSNDRDRVVLYVE